MNSMKLKLLQELLSHLDESQGGDLKSLMDQPEESPMGAIAGADENEVIPGAEPEGMSVEKVSVLGDGGDDLSGGEMDAMGGEKDDMSDDELEQMLRSLG